MKQVIKIPYKPRNWARIVHSASTRWIVLIIHRRGGKTTGAFNHLQRDAINKAGTRYAYVAPTYKQAKRIVWTMAKHYSQNVPGIKYNESELLITYPNGSEIMIVGSDTPDSLRGIALWGAFLDEYPLQSPIVFTEIISKALADHEGYCIFGGTPKGKGHFFKLYQVALKNADRYTLVYKTIDDSLAEERGETIEALRRSLAEDKLQVKDGLMTEDEFQQEWYNSFEAAIRGAVYLKELAEMRKNDRTKPGIYDPRLPVYTVWDLGIRDAMAIGFFQKVGPEVRMIDYYENTGLGLPHYIKIVKDKPYIYGKHFAPHDIKNRELISGKTRLQSASELGIDFNVVPGLSLRDGIDVARAFLHRLWIDGKTCEIFLDFIGQYHYEIDEKRGINKREPEHDFTSHAADVLRYAAIVEDEMTKEDEGDDAPPEDDDRSDDYVGHDEDEDEDRREGMGKHPMMRKVNIGAIGHTKPPQQYLSPYFQPSRYVGIASGFINPSVLCLGDRTDRTNRRSHGLRDLGLYSLRTRDPVRASSQSG